ncbi:aspartyl-tRNA synthetase [Trifolium pratense]|uniref:Aspartyl-tRNA synthetase n=1 Tax=Trifolium pratense TaxID=57577 RepID=A0A2K3NIR3_TRIPR|nr:aspartyl-tRNA synthetase [Trifolium pratense]
MKKPCMEFCEHCVYGKAHRLKFSKSKHKIRGLLDYVHTDVWRSMLQATVALSTTEVEYMAITEGVKEALWLWGLLDNLGIKQEYVDLSCDSQSVIHLVKNQGHHAQTKHIDVFL